MSGINITIDGLLPHPTKKSLFICTKKNSKFPSHIKKDASGYLVLMIWYFFTHHTNNSSYEDFYLYKKLMSRKMCRGTYIFQWFDKFTFALYSMRTRLTSLHHFFFFFYLFFFFEISPFAPLLFFYYFQMGDVFNRFQVWSRSLKLTLHDLKFFIFNQIECWVVVEINTPVLTTNLNGCNLL